MDLHAVQQCPGESLRSFIHRFSQVCNTIPRISNASIVVAFRQGMRDEKMLEKLTMHDIQDVTELLSLAYKCTRAAEGRAWHTPLAPKVGKDSKPNAGAISQGGDNNNNNNNKSKKKKASGNNQPLARASIVVATTAGGGRRPRGDKHLHQASSSDDDGAWCITLRATTLVRIERSRSSWSSSARESSNRTEKACLSASGRANRR
jgi:hypothetical protein